MPFATDQLDFAGAVTSRSRTSGMTALDSAGRMIDVGSNLPAFDFHPRTLAPRGLSCWPGRTNIFSNSQAGLVGGAAQNTLSTSTDIPPLRTGSTIKKHVRDNATTDSNVGAFYCTGAASTTYTASVWLWLPTGQSYSFFSFILTATGANNANTYPDLTVRDQWQRVEATLTTTAAGLLGPIILMSGATGAYFYSTEPQVEVGAFSSPNIITSGSALARAEQDFSVNLGGLLEPTQGALFCEFSCPSVISGAVPVAIDAGTNQNQLLFSLYPDSVRFFVVAGGANVVSATAWMTVLPNTVHRVAASWTGTSLLIALNGTASGSATYTGLPSGLGFLRLGSRGGGFQCLNGHLRRYRLLPVANTLPQLLAMTAA